MKTPLSFPPAFSLVAILAATNAKADDFTWSSASGSTWGIGGNWTQTPTDNGATPDSLDNGLDNILSPSAVGFIQINPASVTVANWTYSNTSSQLVVGNSGATSLNVTGTMSMTAGSQTFRNSGSTNTLDINVGHLSVSDSNGNGHQFGLGDGSSNTFINSFTASSMEVNGGFASFKVGETSGTATVTNTLSLSGTGKVNIRWVQTPGQSGTLAVGGLSSTSSTSIIRVHHGSNATAGLLQLNNATGVNTSFAGILQNGGSSPDTVLSVEKNNVGKQTLSGTNTYSGTTTVNAGTLLVNGTHTGAGAYSVTGGTLGGSGSITTSTSTGGFMVSGGAFLQAGAGAAPSGSFSLGGDLTMQDNSIIVLALGSSGTHSTLARTAGTWTFDGDQSFSFTDLGAAAGTYDNVISGLTGTEAGLSTIGTWTIQNGGWIGTFAYDGSGGVDLNLSAIPEPSSLMLLGGLGMLATFRRNRATTAR